MPGRRGRLLFDPLGDLSEVTGVAEVLVDAGKTDVGNVVERFQAGHYRLANSCSRDFVAEGFHLPLDAADKPIDLRRVDIPFARRMADGARKFVAIERFALAVFLEDGQVTQLHPLERGEARATGLALAAAADSRTIPARAAFLNLAGFVRPEPASHVL